MNKKLPSDNYVLYAVFQCSGVKEISSDQNLKQLKFSQPSTNSKLNIFAKLPKSNHKQFLSHKKWKFPRYADVSNFFLQIIFSAISYAATYYFQPIVSYYF